MPGLICLWKSSFLGFSSYSSAFLEGVPTKLDKSHTVKTVLSLRGQR